MPAPEPMFDIRHFTFEDLAADKLKKELRTFVVLADLNDQKSQVTRMLKEDLGPEKYMQAMSDPTINHAFGANKWADGQIVFYLIGKGPTALTNSIKANFPAMASRMKEHDAPQIHANLFGTGGVHENSQEIISKFGIDLKLPPTFKKARTADENNFIWFTRATKEADQHIIIRKFPYSDQRQLSLDSLIERRNEYGRKYIKSEHKGTYMLTQNKLMPVLQYATKVDGAYTIELRGLWEIENDFKGGPFLTYAILDEKAKAYIFVDCFVYGPGAEKRDYVQQLEYIVQRAKLSGKISS
jgi:hypothetical protein